MSSRYLPVARLKTAPDTPLVLVQGTGHQSVLRSLCGTRDTKTASFEGMACVLFEPCSPMEIPQIRVEVQGRTIGFLTREDAMHYRFKMDKEGWGESSMGIPIRIGGGSLKDDGPPYFYFAHLQLDLSPDSHWDFDLIQDKPENQSAPSDTGSSDSGPPEMGTTVRPPDGTLAPASPARPKKHLSVAGEIFGRGVGFLICVFLFYLCYYFYFIRFFPS